MSARTKTSTFFLLLLIAFNSTVTAQENAKRTPKAPGAVAAVTENFASPVTAPFASNANNAAPEVHAVPETKAAAVRTVSNVPTAAAKNLFTELFPDAREVKWSSLAAGQVVCFLNKGHKVMAGFDPRGRLTYIITTLSGEQLPIEFGQVLSSDYGSFRLLSAKEVKAHGETAYYATLEGANEYVTLKYTRDGMEVEQLVKK